MSGAVLRWRVSARRGDGPPVVLAHSTDRERAERTAMAVAGVGRLTGAERDACAVCVGGLLVSWERIAPMAPTHRGPVRHDRDLPSL